MIESGGGFQRVSAHSDESDRRAEVYLAKKQSSSPVSTLASKILSGDKKPTVADAKKLAASVLSQDEKKGQKK